MNILTGKYLNIPFAFLAISTSHAATVDLALTRLGGSVADDTVIFRGDLSSVGVSELFAITLDDSNSGLGGSPGRFSGFDLDAIKLSQTYANTASEASNAAGMDVFDFSLTGSTFTPGTQRAPDDPTLNGTDSTGLVIDPDYATLDYFDASLTGPGSVSLGDGGSIELALLNGVSTEGLYIYIGEMSGDIGEGLAVTLTGSDVSPVPVPAAFWLFGSAVVGLFGTIRRKHDKT
jgi:hypothetical protein